MSESQYNVSFSEASEDLGDNDLFPGYELTPESLRHSRLSIGTLWLGIITLSSGLLLTLVKVNLSDSFNNFVISDITDNNTFSTWAYITLLSSFTGCGLSLAAIAEKNVLHSAAYVGLTTNLLALVFCTYCFS